jgi:hypothetical protein
MSLLYTVVSLVGLAWFLWRRCDAITVAYLASLTYFLPAWFGYDLRGVPLAPAVYGVYLQVLLSLIMVSWLPQPRLAGPSSVAALDRDFCRVLAILAAAIVLAVLAVYGLATLLQPKTATGIHGYAYIAWRVSGSLAFIAGVLLGQRLLTVIGGLSLALTFVAADRTAIAMVLIALLLHWSWGRRLWLLPLQQPGKCLAVVLVAALLVFGKLLQAAIQIGVMGQPSAALFAPVLVAQQLAALEPFVTQMILNEVVRTGYVLDGSYLAILPLSWLPVSPVADGSGAFNEAVQADLFPQLAYGLAYNFWAEGWVLGRMLGVAVFAATYAFGAYLLSVLLPALGGALRVVMLLAAAYWVFYIHRNSLLTIISYEKQIWWFAAAVGIGALLLWALRRAVARAQAPDQILAA